MGYDLHLTRREYWSNEDGPEISLEEWLAYVATDSEITPHSSNPEDFILVLAGANWPLWWDRGEIYTKNPNERVVVKLVQIAKALNARVLGDDDEIYGVDPGNPLLVERG